MNKSIRKKIPTFVGILILIIGTSAGVILLNAKQIFKLGAQGDATPKNIKISNVADNGFTISFLTNQKSRTFVKVGKDKYFLGETDVIKGEEKTSTHYFNVEDLQPITQYFITINSDGVNYFTDNPWTTKTGPKLPTDNLGIILYGKVYSKSGEALNGAIVYVIKGNGSLLSTVTADDGSWGVNISKARKTDLSKYLPLEEKNTLLQILIVYENLTTFITTYANNIQPLAPIIIGSNYDFRNSFLPIDIVTSPTPVVYGSSTFSKNLTVPLPNIYKER